MFENKFDQEFDDYAIRCIEEDLERRAAKEMLSSDRRATAFLALQVVALLSVN